MAYYTYKRVRNLIPNEFSAKWEAAWKEETGQDYDGSADYDGQLWCLAADYIEHLHELIEDANKTVAGSGPKPDGSGE